MTINGISIIICTFNGRNRILHTLEALIRLEPVKDLRCEVILVDNASTDGTSQIAEDFWSKNQRHMPLKIITEPFSGKANAIKRGYDHSSCELMILCDDDNWLFPDYLIQTHNLFTIHPEISLAGGLGIAHFGTEQEPKWFNKWQTHYACGQYHETSGFLKSGRFEIWGAGSILRKSMWNHLVENGFKFSFSTEAGKPLGEDTELALAVIHAGGKLYFDKHLKYSHDLTGGRVNWYNLLEISRLNGIITAGLTIRHMAYKHQNSSEKTFYLLLFFKVLRLLPGLFFQFIKPGNKPVTVGRIKLIKNLIFNCSKNYTKYKESVILVSKLKNKKFIIQ